METLFDLKKIGEVRALEHEQDPARRRALVARLLAGIRPEEAREALPGLIELAAGEGRRGLWDAFPAELRTRMLQVIPLSEIAQTRWAYMDHIEPDALNDGRCPKCRGDSEDEEEAVLVFNRRAWVDVDAHGRCTHSGADGAGDGPILGQCYGCDYEFIVVEPKR